MDEKQETQRKEQDDSTTNSNDGDSSSEKTIVDEAKEQAAINREILEDLKKERQRIENLEARHVLGGRSVGAQRTPEVTMSDREYANAVLNGQIKPKAA